jgi:hypothetical protein
MELFPMEQNEHQSGKRVFINIFGFLVGTIILLLAVKYALGM